MPITITDAQVDTLIVHYQNDSLTSAELHTTELDATGKQYAQRSKIFCPAQITEAGIEAGQLTVLQLIVDKLLAHYKQEAGI